MMCILLFSTAVSAQKNEFYDIHPDSIETKLGIIEFEVDSLTVTNRRSDKLEVNFRLQGGIRDIIQLSDTSVIIPPEKQANITAIIFARELGSFNGTILVTGDINERIPVVVEVLNEIIEDSVAINVNVEDKKVKPSGKLRLMVRINNLLIENDVPLNVTYFLSPLDENTSTMLHSEEVTINTSLSVLKEFRLDNVPVGDYVVSVIANNKKKSYTSRTSFSVVTPFLDRGVGGVKIKHILIFAVALANLLGGYYYYSKRQEAKKRYKSKLYLDQLPKPGPRSVIIGKLAESERTAYFEIDQLMMHTIVAGSTGGGKSVSAKVLMEEALMKGSAVIVFDPTAQWSGFLRKNVDKKMFALYPRFGMKKEDAHAFNGNVKQILNAREVIDIRKYMKPGEIIIFAVNKLDPSDIDILVANIVKQVFKANLPESKELKMLLVFDEVHRLLPKFGGSGQGFLQIERAAREFRKWGVGIILISQVLTDFAGETKANIANEIQMRTRDEGDLNRIKTKYGDFMLQSLIKAATGTGMYENASFNRGEPYFVAFRPLLHEHAALDDETLAEYNKYNDIIDDIEYQVEQLVEEKVDVFDLKLEMKMALDKVKQGNFNMVTIYLDSLKPRLESEWQKLGRKPKKRERLLVSEAELLEDYKKAERFRKQEEKKAGPKKQEKEVKMLRLKNGLVVLSVMELEDAFNAIDAETFDFHQKKGDFAKWITQFKPELSRPLQGAKTKEEALSVLKTPPEKKGEK